MIYLRGHHLFCLLGYRGMGYSPEYVENMTRIHQNFRKNPETLIKIVNGPDHLCDKFPATEEYHCQNLNIYDRDASILRKMNLEIGQVLKWKEIETRILKHITSSDIGVVCETCTWRSLGVCEEGIEEIHQGKGLRAVY
ncbi:DUF1284 domain-containing protein [Ureibacillus aquaedulcis]|uniref:DUF1284 domain-containing protein n=1 Tax=Ureibacillus aquaedulcis TaxID=3058421 RepID=A0ABT8GKJ7_9BACL|nr:DUF1284 domain-containing protein [Ureibacillus sp. BA0131]MDN4491942.1 DUF1284 domain-containing protein [Ureibacillus sp. BA0131]